MFPLHEWLSAPDEPGGTAGSAASSASTPAPSSAPAATPSPSAPSSPSPSSATAASSPASGSAAAAPGAAAQWTGVREALAGLGIDLRQQFQDDNAALSHLAMAYRQNQQLQPFAPYLQQYAQYGEQFQAWLRQQQAQQSQQAQQAQQWWKPPEYDPRWVNMVQRNPITGQMEPAAGAPPDVVQKLQAAEAHRRGFLEKFAFDPVGAIKPGIEQVVAEVAQRLIQQQLGGYRDQQSAQQFIQENSGWLHARDAQGQVQRDPMSGRPQLSEWGQRFAGYLRQWEPQYGPQAAQAMALTAIQRDFLYSQQQGTATTQQAAAAGQAANQQFLQNAAAARQPNNAVAQPGQPTQTPGKTLRERLKANMQANGFTADTPIPVGRG